MKFDFFPDWIISFSLFLMIHPKYFYKVLTCCSEVFELLLHAVNTLIGLLQGHPLL